MKSKSKANPQKKAKQGTSRANPLRASPDYVAIAKDAYTHGKSAALKANGSGYNRSWKETPEPTRIGFIAMTKFIARKLRRHLNDSANAGSHK